MDESQKTPLTGISRDKFWSELDESEQIERMRQEVKRNQIILTNLITEMERLDRLFYSHDYLNNGVVFHGVSKLHQPLDAVPLNKLGVPGKPNEVYF